MGNLVGINGRVFSFELIPQIAQQQKRNIELNGLKNVVLEMSGLGDDNKEIEVFWSEKWNTGNIKENLLESAAKKRIGKILRLDDYVLENKIEKIDFIKCDVDGSEIGFLKGARKTLSKFKPSMIIELNEECQLRHGSSCSEVFDEIAPYGYKYKLVSTNEKFDPLSIKDWRGFSDNLLCIL